jgi:hypothetical protein
VAAAGCNSIRALAALRPEPVAFRDPAVATRVALRSLARRILELTDEIAEFDERIRPLVAELAPQLVGAVGIGTEIAGQLLVTAGAVAESFFATLKKELVHRASWPTRQELGSAVF